MDENLKEYKKLLEEDIKLLGYEELRYSIFAGEENNRQEYQVRIEKNQELFEVYMTAERASVANKYEYKDIFQAFNKFLNIMQLVVLSNRKSIRDGELPEYSCRLWD